MTSEAFTQIMLKLDKRLRGQKRNILVMLDNCSSHPSLNLNNIKLLFLPPNTTSRLQALDVGIIMSLKQRYRNKMLEYIIELLDENLNQNCSDAVKTITLLKAIYLMDSSLKEIPDSVFIHCFRECGIIFEEFSSENQEETAEEFFAMNNWHNINERLELGFNSFEEFVSYDENIVCRQELTDEEIIEMVRPATEIHESSYTEIDESVIELNDTYRTPTKTEALKSVFELRLYLGSLNEVDDNYYDILNKFEKSILNTSKTSKQSLITDYRVFAYYLANFKFE